MHDERDALLMTPGPTALPPAVRDAMARPLVNPDVEPAFAAFYRDLLEKLQAVHGTDDDVVVLGGEGMLGLEASVASLVDDGDEVLCLANGLFGAGFADLVELHGGDPVTYEVGTGDPFDGDAVDAVEDLVEDHQFVAATMVHCETPIGVLNDLDGVLDVLGDAGVLTIVDAVSSLGGAPVPADRIDVCLGASQKCFSAPPGLSTLTVSDRAWDAVDATDQDSFYASLAPWRAVLADLDDAVENDDAVLLPYTHLVSDLYALDAALDRILGEGLEQVHERHADAAERCRERGRDLGLEPFPGSPDRCSPTVTAFRVDDRASDLQARLRDDHDVILATGLGEHADDVLRVGHMGYGADVEKVDRVMDALDAVLAERGYSSG